MTRYLFVHRLKNAIVVAICALFVNSCSTDTLLAPVPAPVLASLSEAIGVRGSTMTVSVWGANFVPGATMVVVGGTGVGVADIVVRTEHLLTVTFAVASDAPIGQHEVSVATLGGSSPARMFTVLPLPPALASIAPNVGVQGVTTTVSLAGTNFVPGGTTVTVSGANVAVQNVSVKSGALLTADVVVAAGAGLGARTITITTAGGTSAPLTFTINPPVPTLTSLSALIGVTGTTVTETLTGTNFVTGATVAVSGTGVTVSNVVVVSGTSLTASFTIAAGAALGARDVTVTTVGGTSSARTFIVNPPLPTLTGVTPATGVQGTVVPVTIAGTDFVAGSTVVVDGSGVGVGPVAVTSGTSLTTTLTVAASATLGAHALTVTTAGGTTTAQTFTVLPPTPAVASITPSLGRRGSGVGVVINGTNFVNGATSVVVDGTGVSVGNVVVNSATTISATFTIDAAAGLGDRSVSVTTAGGTSGSLPFTVLPLVPTLASVAPNVVVQGTTQTVTLTGTDFVSGASTVAVSGTGVAVNNINVSSGTSLTADLTVAGNAALGARSVTVTTAGGTSGAQTLVVNPRTPTLASVAPSVGVQGMTQSVVLTGTNFVPGATTVAVSGAGVTVSNVSVSSATSLTADVAVAAGAALGARTVTVTTVGGTSGSQTLTINSPVPTLSSLTPSVGVQGTTQSVTFTGTDFVTGATTVNVTGAGVTVGNIIVNGGTSLTAEVTVAAGAALGTRAVTVSTVGGTSGAQTFIVNPPLPTLTSATPNEGTQGSIETVTFTGTDFVDGATTVNVSGAGITVSAANVTSSTSLTVNLDVAAGAALGARTITVTTPGGTSNTLPFTILPPPPTLASVAPSAGVRGTTQSVTLTGTDFMAGATTVNVSGANVVVSNVNVSSGTSLTADFAIGTSAALGARAVTVTTAGGTSGGRPFTINPPPPTLGGISPSTGAQGGNQTVTLTGTDFVAGATTVTVSGTGVTVSNVNVTSATTLTADFATSGAAALSARNVIVTTAGGSSVAQIFTVVAAPSITSFAARATHLTVRQSVIIDWTTAGATNCSVQPTIFGVPCNGNGIVTPKVNTTYTLTAANAGASVSATTSVFVNEPGRWVFSTASTNNQLRTFSLNAADGDLTPIGGGTVGSGTSPYGIAVDPAGKYAYAVNLAADNVSMYTINATTGALTANGTIPSGNEPVQIAVDPTGRYAYVANRNQIGTGSISQYTINGSGQLVANGTVTVGNQPYGIAIDQLGRYVWVANRSSGTIQAFTINSNGTLTLIRSATKANAMYLTADPSGRFLYSSNDIAQTVSQWGINQDGTLVSLGADLFLGGTIRGIVAEPTGHYVYAADFNNNIMHWYSINQTNGALGSHGTLSMPGGPFIQPEMIATDPQGKFLYSANSGANNVTIFSINSSSGALSILRNVAAGTGPLGIAVSR